MIYRVTLGAEVYEVCVEKGRAEIAVPAEGELRRTERPPAARSAPGRGTPVAAPLPGKVTGINVKLGQKVERGQIVAVIEAMKMENEVAAQCSGVVHSIAAAVGERVAVGDTIMTWG